MKDIVKWFNVSLVLWFWGEELFLKFEVVSEELFEREEIKVGC